MNEVKNGEMDQTLDLGEKSNKTLIFIIVGVVLLLIAGFAYYYFGVVHNSEVLVNKYVNKLYGASLDVIDDVNDKVLDIELNNDAVEIDGNLKMSFDGETDEIDYSKLKDYTFNIKSIISYKDKQGYASLGIKDKDNDFLSLETSFDENKLLLASKELFDKIVEVPLDEEISFDLKDINDVKLFTEDDIKTIISFNRDYTLKYLKGLEYESSTGKVGDKSSFKTTFKIDNKNIKEYALGFVDEIINDSKMLEILSKAEINIDMLKSLKEEISSSEVDSNYNLTINLYTNTLTGSFMRFEVISANEVIASIEKSNKTYTIKIGEGQLTYDESKKVLTIGDEEVSFQFTFNNNELIIENNMSLIYNMNNKATISYNVDKEEANISMKVESSMNGIDMSLMEEFGSDINFKPVKLTMDANLTISKTTSVKRLEGTIINEEELENYSEEIMTNLDNKVKGTIFEDLLSSIIMNNNYDEEYDYGYTGNSASSTFNFQTLYRIAETEILNSQLLGEDVYVFSSNCTGSNCKEISSVKDLDYCIGFDKNGFVTTYAVTDGEYFYYDTLNPEFGDIDAYLGSGPIVTAKYDKNSKTATCEIDIQY